MQDDVAGQPDPFCRSWAKKERGARTAHWCVWAVWTSARAGVQDVGASSGFHQWIRPVVLYTMVCSKTRLKNFDF